MPKSPHLRHFAKTEDFFQKWVDKCEKVCYNKIKGCATYVAQHALLNKCYPTGVAEKKGEI